ncbi:hypothetical protein [Sporisorium scitamineum]|uniref:Uncharacterized protein n=1 Tax=Sporisorium scitamineum TaxID=49012 RepID=A0A0F7S006_9BASI|nr:hypothetical protein [Sporisorium scitamineum]
MFSIGPDPSAGKWFDYGVNGRDDQHECWEENQMQLHW